MDRYYIGLAATLHDPALAILDPSGRPLFAEATERYLQNKRAYNCPPDDLIRLPALVEQHCGRDAELMAAVNWSAAFLAQLDAICQLPPGSRAASPDEDVLAWPLPAPQALTHALRNSLRQAGLNLTAARTISPHPVPVRRFDHHLTHAAAAAYTSPFEECCVAVVDGFGEGSSTACFYYRDGRLTALDAGGDAPGFQPTASLGHFYSRLCALCGFDPLRGEEWKVMGLAPYGKHDAELYGLLRPMIAVRDLALVPGLPEAEIAARLRHLRRTMRPPGSSPLDAADLARTGQEIFEEILGEWLSNLWRHQPCDRLALAGGCALNSSANGKIVERTRFREVHLPPAPADDGTALGAALLAFYADHPRARPPAGPTTPYLGSSLETGALDRLVRLGGCRLEQTADAPARAAELLARGKIVGWVQGAAEYGPRALGNRSILADPRPGDMKDRINERVKFREEFRPFAPAILDAHGAEYFAGYQSSPYMDRTLVFHPEVRDRVPAVVHVNGTGRLQSVRREWNPRFHDLIAAFHAATGVPLVLNTSFNVMGKPILHSVEDALGMFFTSGLDALFLEDYLIEKTP